MHAWTKHTAARGLRHALASILLVCLPSAACDGVVGPDASADAARDDGGGAPLCLETCRFSRDGECDDGASGAITAECDYGTDCQDCGPRPPVACAPRCPEGACGDDGCGGSCPACPNGLTCAGGACRDFGFVGRPCTTCDGAYLREGRCLGASADTRAMCGSDEALCRRGAEAPEGYCTIACDDTSECPSGYRCMTDDPVSGTGCFRTP